MIGRGRDKQDSVIQVADRIHRSGLALPAVVLLEAGRPLALIAAQLVYLSQPILALMMPRHAVASAAELLEDPESVGALIELLGREHGDQVGGQ